MKFTTQNLISLNIFLNTLVNHKTLTVWSAPRSGHTKGSGGTGLATGSSSTHMVYCPIPMPNLLPNSLSPTHIN